MNVIVTLVIEWSLHELISSIYVKSYIWMKLFLDILLGCNKRNIRSKSWMTKWQIFVSANYENIFIYLGSWSKSSMDFQCTRCQHNHIIWNNRECIGDYCLEEASPHTTCKRKQIHSQNAHYIINIQHRSLGVVFNEWDYKSCLSIGCKKLFLCCFLCLGRISRILYF